jgi:DNA-binding NtrC family response regulator
MILVIDDDRVSRKIVTRALDRMGLKSLECENGRQAWEVIWENNEINLVITDMVMPDMDGRELVHLIRAHDEVNQLPVIMISGVLSTDEIEPIIKVSPTNTFFLAKPLDIDLLTKHVEAIGVRNGREHNSSTTAH